MKKLLTSKAFFVSLGILLILGLGASSVYFYSKYQAIARTVNTNEKEEEIKKLVASVSRLITVPTDEIPTVATVSDAEKLKNQPFFLSSQNGDKVLIFASAKKAILYRPGEDKIVEVSPITIGASASAQVKTDIRFALYNGSGVTGLTKRYETELKEKVSTAVVGERANAKKSDYTQSILIDLSNSQSAQAKELAETLGLELSSLPAGESKPDNAEFLIILGSDKK